MVACQPLITWKKGEERLMNPPTFPNALAEIAVDAFVAHVSAALRETLLTAGGRASEVARRLGTSERSLRRGLAECGTSHSVLLDGVRRDLAFALEARRCGGQIDVAVEPGYASASAYRLAFRRWTGSTPGRWRRELTDG